MPDGEIIFTTGIFSMYQKQRATAVVVRTVFLTDFLTECMIVVTVPRH